jgi:hypothetical protein
VIKSAVAEHLKVLSNAGVGRFRVIEGICHAGAFNGLLRHTVHHTRLGDASTQIAVRLGIWEFGRFFRDYRLVVGERSSETLRK